MSVAANHIHLAWCEFRCNVAVSLPPPPEEVQAPDCVLGPCSCTPCQVVMRTGKPFVPGPATLIAKVLDMPTR